MFSLLTALALPLLGVSDLWGETGELWDPSGRLPDYSYAGCFAGSQRIPTYPVVADVKLDFGAVGDGTTDDTAAFQNALANMPRGRLNVPQGNYLISDVLHIDRTGVQMRGAGSGPNGSVLTFTRSLQEITGEEHPWDFGLGGLIRIGKGPNGVNWASLGPLRAHVVAPAVRGDRSLTLSSTTGIRRGDFLVLKLTDDAARTLGRHLHNDQAAAGNCSWQPLPIQWPVQIVARHAGTVILAQPLRFDVDLAWSPKLYDYDPVRESGVERLRLEFPPHADPLHLEEIGFNPLTFEGARDCWARNIKIVNADNGPSFASLTKRCTMKNVRLLAGVNGHHGFSFTGGAADCALEQFTIEPLFRHAITLDHLANGNVVRNGSGTDINLDHHRDSPFENLFSNVSLGLGTQPFESGGSACAGPHAGARNTYWNVYADGWSTTPTPIWDHIQTNVIPSPFTSTTIDRQWLEFVPDLIPLDLYYSQLQRRLGL